ncbi:MAG: hypothetical protein ABJN69_04955 [Hellea sp.]
MSRKFILTLLLGSSLCATGCATTAKGVSASAMKSTAVATPYRAAVPEGTTLAVVRYPAHVDTDAQDAFYKAFGQNAVGGQMSRYDATSPEVQGLADSIILKSNYFALSLYKELAERLPEHSVLLSPHLIKKGADGKLTSEPMTQAESLANVVTVDFVSYTFPDSTKMMGKEPLTFGDLVTPLVTVKTDYRAAVPTQGLLLASRPLIPHAATNGKEGATETLAAMQSGRLAAPVPDLDFVAFLNGEAGFVVPQKPLARTGDVNAVRSYGLEKVKLDGAALNALKEGQSGVIDPLESTFSSAFANQIVGIINNTDTDIAAMAGRAAAISQFDESLGALTLVGSEDPAYATRLRYAERLLEAEKNYLSVQSLRLFDGVHNGEMGAQVRDMLKAEYDILEQRRSLARKQNTATALAILGAVAAGAAIANGGSSDRCEDSRTQREYNDCRRRAERTDYGNSVLTNLAIQGAIVAAQEAMATNRRSKAVGGNYLASIAPALEEQQTVQVSLIDSNETITAIRFEDLKEKLQTLYTKNQRSLDTVATRCAYNHDGAVKIGTWMGVCDGGLASGSGVGVLRNADGTSIEYYGYAQNGRPSGPGYMIHHDADQSYAVEGNFSAGLANGVMRVSKSGQADVLRNYQAGQDIGAASSLEAVSSPFNGPVNMTAIN